MFNCENTTVLCIDFQEKLVNIVQNEAIKSNGIKLMKASSILNMDVIITEQYPKGLEETILEIKSLKDFKITEKITFSALQTPNFPKIKNKNVILFGIESHICVFQTALDLINQGYQVFIPFDCCASRKESDKSTALNYLAQKGINVLSLEIILFELLKSSKHPNFKEIQALIK
ncbi:isochorismatase family protein [bacterium]|nr:isochorismatase family protein [bacterium]